MSAVRRDSRAGRLLPLAQSRPSLGVAEAAGTARPSRDCGPPCSSAPRKQVPLRALVSRGPSGVATCSPFSPRYASLGSREG